MAVFNINFFSKSLRLQTAATIVIPFDLPAEEYPYPPEVYKPIYLLHGYSANNLEWLHNAPLPRLAAEHDTAFILANGGKSFYLNNQVTGEKYEDFICYELPEFCNKILPLSKKREDITLGGLSMGGFGAMRNGLAHPNIFGNILALSSAFITDKVAAMDENASDLIVGYDHYTYIFGKLDKLLGGVNDPKHIASKAKELAKEIPNIYMACGTEDFLIEHNRDFHKHLSELGIKHTYIEAAGVHDWMFWSEYLEQSLKWLKEVHHDSQRNN